MKSNPLVEELNSELTTASPDLVENSDLLRGVLAGCGDCIKILDLDGHLIFMSEGGKRVMEVDDFSPLKGCPWPQFWAGEGNTNALAAVASARTGKTARFKGAANTAKGTPKYWDVQVSPICDSNGKPSHLLSISRDITGEWQAGERQRFLTEELKHRVKNTFSTVMAIANQTFRADTDRERRETFNARLTALSNAYEILTETNWSTATIRKIVEGALAHQSMDDGRFIISGPDIAFDAKQGLALALAINELGTNAMKYGSLSVPSGKVEIVWSREASDDGATFQFSWREADGPAVREPARKGFGTRVIKTLLEEDLEGTVDVAYEPAGLILRLQAPLRAAPTEH